MSWVKITDDFPDHPKIVGLDDRAFRIHVWALCYCARHLTDGFVALRALRGCPAVTRKYTAERALRVLCGAGLWVDVEGGIQVCDYLDYNTNRASVLKKREAAAERQARWRENEERRRNARRNGVTGKGRNASPDPTPLRSGGGKKASLPAGGSTGGSAAGERPVMRCPECGPLPRGRLDDHLRNVHGWSADRATTHALEAGQPELMELLREMEVDDRFFGGKP